MKNLISVAILALMIAAASPSMASNHCMPWEAFVVDLREKYQEVPVGVGLTYKGRALTVFASESGTWSILETNNKGISCITNFGQKWEPIPQTELPIEDDVEA